MKGFIRTCAPLSLLSLACLTGCYSNAQERHHNHLDPCWPERYSAMAAGSVNHAFAAQVGNGHVLDQTVYNDCFCPGTAEKGLSVPRGAAES